MNANKERYERFRTNKTRLVVWLDNADFRRLSHAAKLCGTTKARLVRELVACYLQRLEAARDE